MNWAATHGYVGGQVATFTVLFVSTGNVCRSPMAERLAERELSRTLGPTADAFRLCSAGTWGHDGAHMEDHARAVLAEHGARESAFVARELLPDQVLSADLVLTGSAEQRHQVHLLDPHAVDRTFTLREFARLASVLDVGAHLGEATARARTLVEAAAHLRRRILPASVPEDIADPYGAPQHVFRLCAAEILECLSVFVDQVSALSTPQRGRAVS